jgi:hypothetical protein
MSGLQCNPNGILDHSFEQYVLQSIVESRASTIIVADLSARILTSIAVQSTKM